MDRTLIPPAVLAALVALFLAGGSLPAFGAEALYGAGPLPEPPRSGGPTLLEALWGRRSVREFSDRQLSRKQLGHLLWAACGINRPGEKKRTIPSAWEAYPISIYVTSKDGTFIYHPGDHSLKPAKKVAEKDLRGEIPRAGFTKTAPVVLVLVADYSRYERSKPESRRRYANAECGAIAQNIYLASAAMGLGTVMTADVRPEQGEILGGLGKEEEALYVIPVGYPKEP